MLKMPATIRQRIECLFLFAPISSYAPPEFDESQAYIETFWTLQKKKAYAAILGDIDDPDRLKKLANLHHRPDLIWLLPQNDFETHQSLESIDTLRKLGIECRLKMFDGAGHSANLTFTIHPPDQKMVEFWIESIGWVLGPVISPEESSLDGLIPPTNEMYHLEEAWDILEDMDRLGHQDSS